MVSQMRSVSRNTNDCNLLSAASGDAAAQCTGVTGRPGGRERGGDGPRLHHKKSDATACQRAVVSSVDSVGLNKRNLDVLVVNSALTMRLAATNTDWPPTVCTSPGDGAVYSRGQQIVAANCQTSRFLQFVVKITWFHDYSGEILTR